MIALRNVGDIHGFKLGRSALFAVSFKKQGDAANDERVAQIYEKATKIKRRVDKLVSDKPLLEKIQNAASSPCTIGDEKRCDLMPTWNTFWELQAAFNQVQKNAGLNEEQCALIPNEEFTAAYKVLAELEKCYGPYTCP